MRQHRSTLVWRGGGATTTISNEQNFVSTLDLEPVVNEIIRRLGERQLTSPSAAKELALPAKEVCRRLNISYVTLYRLRARGLLCPVPGIRHLIYSVAAVERFLARKPD